MKKKRKIHINLMLIGILSLSFFNVQAQSYKGQKAKEGAGTGALLGAVAGVVFGSGHILDDALEGAIIGGGIGALSGALDGGKMDRQAKEEFEALVREFGEDNLRGYVELLKCNHDKAVALAKVGQASNDREHKLVGLWLEAVVEKDRKNTDRVNKCTLNSWLKMPT